MPYVSDAGGCELCPRLVRSRQRIMFPRGETSARAMFITSSPQPGDEYTGFIFGNEWLWNDLKTWMEFAGLKEQDVFYTLLTKCRPPKGKPHKAEIKTCSSTYLSAELEAVNPEYIVCFDATSFNHFLPVEKRGKVTYNKYTNRLYKFHELPVATVVPLPSPAYVRRRGMSAAHKAVEVLTEIAESFK